MGADVDYVFVGDDFTGASDTLATLARAGRRVRLFLDPPDPAVAAEERLDAVGIATELRALRADTIAEQAAALVPAIRALSPRIVHYKVCSTFDSTPGIGSIGAAAATLERLLAPVLVAVIGGQPSLGRYCIFGNLFARGPDGRIHRIDRHPVMAHHPITPMTESDLLLHLSAQGLEGLELVAWPALEEGPRALMARLAECMRAGARRVLFDACEQSHLAAIGTALGELAGDGRPLFVVGASSVAEAFAGEGRQAAAVEASLRGRQPEGPCLVVAGSRSATTAAQVAAARHFTRMPIGARDLADAAAVRQFSERCVAALANGANVLAHLLPGEDYRLAGSELSLRLADLVAAIFDRHPVPTLGIAGGDTSSILVHRLGLASLAFERQLDPGVAICTARSGLADRNGLRLMLKGGQVGSEAVFDRFLTAASARP